MAILQLAVALSVNAESPVPTCTVEPGVVARGEPFKVRVSGAHTELALVAPNGDYYFVVFDRKDPALPEVGRWTSQEFRRRDVVEIDPSSFEAFPYRFGASDFEKPFTAVGKYRFIVGNPIDNEWFTSSRCEVRIEDVK